MTPRLQMSARGRGGGGGSETPASATTVARLTSPSLVEDPQGEPRYPPAGSSRTQAPWGAAPGPAPWQVPPTRVHIQAGPQGLHRRGGGEGMKATCSVTSSSLFSIICTHPHPASVASTPLEGVPKAGWHCHHSSPLPYRLQQPRAVLSQLCGHRPKRARCPPLGTGTGPAPPPAAAVIFTCLPVTATRTRGRNAPVQRSRPPWQLGD